MNIKSVDTELKENLETYYYPRHVAVWKVTFRTIFATRKELVFTFGDGVTGNIGIVDDIPDISDIETDENQLIPWEIDDDDFYDKSKEALRKYFIYKRKVWKVPHIECDYVDSFFVPYQIEKKSIKSGKTQYFLYEPMSGMYEDLKKHKVINKFVLKEGELEV